MKCNWQDAESVRQRLSRDGQAKRDRYNTQAPFRLVSHVLRADWFFRGLLRNGLGLELLDHAVQSVLMRGSYSQKL